MTTEISYSEACAFLTECAQFFEKAHATQTLHTNDFAFMQKEGNAEKARVIAKFIWELTDGNPTTTVPRKRSRFRLIRETLKEKFNDYAERHNGERPCVETLINFMKAYPTLAELVATFSDELKKENAPIIEALETYNAKA